MQMALGGVKNGDSRDCHEVRLVLQNLLEEVPNNTRL